MGKSGATMTRTLPLVPLPVPMVLLPGVSMRIPLQGRGDIAAVLANIYSKSASPKPDAANVTVGCVPINSQLLSPDGKRLIQENDDVARAQQAAAGEVDPAHTKKEDLFRYGTVAKVTGVQGRRQGELALLVEGTSRFKIEKIVKSGPFHEAKITQYEDEVPAEGDKEIQGLFENLKQLSREFVALIRLSALLPRGSNMTLSPLLGRRLELYIVRKQLQDAGDLADFMTNFTDCTHEDKLQMLASIRIKQRLERSIELLQKEVSNLQGNGQLVSLFRSTRTNPDAPEWRDPRFTKLVRDENKSQLGGNGEEPNELEELKKKLDDAKLSPEARKVADRELKRYSQMMPQQAEHQILRNYLETLAEIPWSKVTEENLDAATLAKARQQFDDDHYGLEKVKKRLLEYLAVMKLKQAVHFDLDKQIQVIAEAAKAKTDDADKQVVKKNEEQAPKLPEVKSSEELKLLQHKKAVDKSPLILLLVGPPGVGKTSLAKSVATALGRKFHRLSLGGVRDEAEIRGHRRTYVAAMPGLIVNGLKKVGVANPVFLLDEIDKVGHNSHHGDPSAAMLEVLDPEQNHSFLDHYINIPIDLSKVLFIATANSLDTIPPPLLDRMETIQLSGYTTLEKRHIARRHLLGKQITTNGLKPEHVSITDDVLERVITAYTREAGVRNLEREIGSVCRAKAVQYAEAKDTNTLPAYSPVVTIEDLDDILGIERFEEEIAARISQPGVVTGLVAYSGGTQGSILFIEIADMPGGGRVQLTGKLGDVLKESVEVALSWVKSHAYELALTHDMNDDIMKSRSIHVHCPSGAVPKDGPSAGLAHTVALISLFSNKSVPPTIAMTGEISLRGKVLPVGGVKEKLIGALRAGVKKVLLPVGNRKEAKDLPMEVKQGLEIVHVGHVWEALPQIWPDAQWPGRQEWSTIESRL